MQWLDFAIITLGSECGRCRWLQVEKIAVWQAGSAFRRRAPSRRSQEMTKATTTTMEYWNRLISNLDIATPLPKNKHHPNSERRRAPEKPSRKRGGTGGQSMPHGRMMGTPNRIRPYAGAASKQLGRHLLHRQTSEVVKHILRNSATPTNGLLSHRKLRRCLNVGSTSYDVGLTLRHRLWRRCVWPPFTQSIRLLYPLLCIHFIPGVPICTRVH